MTTLAGLVPWVDGLGTVARFNDPYGVSVDSNGAVYVADSSNTRIRMISSSGVCLDTLHISLASFVSVRCPSWNRVVVGEVVVGVKARFWF